MKTRPLRRITVDSVTYLWGLNRHNGDGDGGIGLRVWRGKIKVLDEWLSGLNKPDAITPRFVAERIKILVS